MTLHIDTDDLERLGLDMRELWVLTALRVLSSHKPWKGTYEDLKTKSHCGSKSSAQRIVEILKEKGWVIETDEGFTVSSQIGTKPSQNGTDSSQNRTESSQNRTNSKEKEKNQKKIENIKLKEDKVCELSHTRARREIFIFDFYKMAICEFGYLHPPAILEEMYSYYDSHVWPQGWRNGNQLKVWQNWLRREGKLKGGRQPDINDEARKVMQRFIEQINPQVIERLVEVVENVTVEPTKIKFFVKAGDAEAFAKWMGKIDVVKLLAEFEKEVKIAMV